MNKRSKSKRYFASFVAALFTLNMISTAIKVKAEDNDVLISLKPQYNADIVLTVEDSAVDPTNFQKDLRTKLNELGIKDSRIKIAGLKAQEVNTQDNFAWDVYDHKGNWGEDNYPNGDGQVDKKNNQHIIVKNNGKNITFYGYGQPAYKDFMFMANDSTLKKTFQFDLDENGINYHSMEGGGFLFNSKIEGGKLSGYCVLFTELGISVYEIKNVDANAFHNYVDYNYTYTNMAKYEGITLVKSYSKTNSKLHSIKIETDSKTLSLWDNGKLIIGNLALGKTQYGNGFGPIASYFPHNCNILSYFAFNNLSMQTTNVTKFKDLIRKPQWDSASKKFVVNLNDTSDEDFHNASTYAEIQSRIGSEGIHYIGWGTNANKAEAEDLVAKNNGKGTFISNSNYAASIDSIANYIFDQLKQSSSGETKVIIGQPMDVAVTPESLKENTANSEFPLGGWKLDHDDSYYENSMGKATFDGQYMDNLNMVFDKPGKYGITFRDNVVSPNTVYAHRLPVANFDAKVINNSGSYSVQIVDSSYDEDGKNKADKGIKVEKWQWRELGSTTWTDGQIPENLETGKQYMIQLMVQDYDGAWSIPAIKYISTKEDSTEKPLASFILTPEKLYTPIVKDITLIDNSYDPQGKEITDRLWTVEKDGKVIYSGSTPMTDFSGKTEGNYTVLLKVKTTIWSESFSRSFTIKDVEKEANAAIGDVNIGYAEGDNANSVTKDVTLPAAGTNGTLVRWRSDDVSVTKYGKVTRPGFLQGDKTVQLTATLYNNGANSTKNFTVVVKALPNTPPVIVNGEKNGYINTTLQFIDTDFTSNYSDAEGSAEKSILITSLSMNGKLMFDGKEVSINQEIQIADINKLSFVPDNKFVGKAEFSYKANDGYAYSSEAKFTINILDNVAPSISNVSIKSNNVKNPIYAKEGDVIALDFAVSEALAENPKVTILGNEATVSKVGAAAYRAEYKLKDRETQGIAKFIISNVKDIYNNEAQPISLTTDESYAIVDTIAPVISGATEGRSYKPGIELTSNEGVLLLNGKEFNSGAKVSIEGDYTLKAEDNAGNVSEIKFNIDGTPPVISEVENNKYYNKSVTPKYNEGTATINGKPFKSGDEITDEGTYTIIATDRAGNVSTVTFVIDKTPPVIKNVVEGGQYNTDVSPTFDKGNAILDGKEYHSGQVVTSEGKHTIVVTDNAGNVSTVNFIIDKTAPVITGVSNGEYYSNDREISFNEGTATLDGEPFTNGGKVSAEGQHIIVVVDGAGNITSETFVIDKTAPVISGVEDGKAYNEKVVITFNEGEAILDGAAFNNGAEVTQEGTHTITVKDKAGNVTTKTFTIDKTAPIVTNAKLNETYKEDVAPEFNEGTATLDGKPYISGTKITEEGTHTLIVKDKAGNTTVVTFTIDKSMPRTLDLRGRVYSVNGNEAGAKVTLEDIDGKLVGSTVTDKDGNYSFKNEKIGLYKVLVDQTGLKQIVDVNLQPSKPTDKEKAVDVYLSRYRVIVTANPNSIVGDGEDTTTLTVTVVDEKGNPVNGKTVTITVTSGDLLNGNTIITDKDGNALFKLKAPKVNGDDMTTATVTAKVDGLDVPVANNAIIHFAPGSIKGVVVDNETGLPVEGAVIEVSKDFDNNGIPEFYAKYITKKDGKYKIAIPKGNVEYQVKITKKVKVGEDSKEMTFHQKIKAGSVTSQGKESYNASNTATGVLLMKNPNGDTSLLKDYSNYNVVIVDENGEPVMLPSESSKLDNGVFNFSELEKNKTYYANIYYQLPDGSKIKLGASKIAISNEGEINITNCLIDPYGDVTNKETGKLITGAKVRLYYANTARNLAKGIKPDTLVELPTVNDFPPADNLNPQQSDINGKYAWMVFPNTDYYIVAEADGYEKYVSPLISVDTEIVRHDIKMTPIKDSNNTGGILPKTGRMIDDNVLLAIGALFTVLGLFIGFRKRNPYNN